MLNRQLPLTINVKKLTEQEIQLEGALPVSKLTRVLEAVESAEGEIYLELAFRKDEQSARVAQGQASCTVKLLCQRCLKPYEHALKASFSLAFVYTEAQEERLPEIYDPVLMQDDNVRLVDLIEDDLILALPIVAHHTSVECQTLRYEEGESVAEVSSTKENPFKVLEALKDREFKGSKNKP
ncbi:MAG: DUF177 domain-containing protein [Pseudomonadales bacterium]|nr:DUF177 domain-containing protein [Pseudomonadales bacterium]